MPDTQATDTGLAAVFAADDTQRLIWQITLRSGVLVTFVEVDATTGTAVPAARG